jgi:hypothetical protein
MDKKFFGDALILLGLPALALIILAIPMISDFKKEGESAMAFLSRTIISAVCGFVWLFQSIISFIPELGDRIFLDVRKRLREKASPKPDCQTWRVPASELAKDDIDLLNRQIALAEKKGI